MWADTLRLVLVCLRVGTFAFGGGFVMIPLLRPDVVERYHWVAAQEFMDAVALGQMTPGPLLVTVTFIGYKLSGLIGATLATIAIFLPSFMMTIVASRTLTRWQDNRWLQGFLWGVRPAVVGLILGTAITLAPTSLTQLWQLALLGLALFALLTERVGAGVVIVSCGIIGLVIWGRG